MRYLCIAVLLLGCQPRADRATSEVAEAADHAQRVTSTGDRGNCGAAVRPSLSGEGIGELHVGRPAAEIAARCVVLTDTVVPGPEALPEREMSILVAGTDTVVATIVNDSVWRLQLESTGIRTVDSLGVGSRLADLLRSGRGRARGVEGEGQLFVLLEEHCGVSFRVDLEIGEAQHRAEWSAVDLARLDVMARVDRLLVVGCRVR